MASIDYTHLRHQDDGLHFQDDVDDGVCGEKTGQVKEANPLKLGVESRRHVCDALRQKHYDKVQPSSGSKGTINFKVIGPCRQILMPNACQPYFTRLHWSVS